ncbi:Oidioi.mRNA.OKI2018_I69.chr2.g5779.t1.cds [Oikopleura dioica]|uniref:Oidioi.mRNA.OKI2018_I69.chr2.g5779.t1.cds n=1 Tax=Oikopleura dioica TaxID=34765 RepID=A0ABN7T7C5_OIKDI|nr:Oidioi.mRNA.OKI2018_I69.chr2.g5779.t1.cds [Oikopleura dioica]
MVFLTILAAIGFTKVGIAAGSIAAFLQTPFTVAGGLFATFQSVAATGVVTFGVAMKIIGGIGAAIGTFGALVAGLFSLF